MNRSWLKFTLAATVALAGGGAVAAPALASGGAPPAPRAAVSTIPSPIGPITEDENTWMHTHPVNLTQYMADSAYRAQILALPAMAATAAQDAALNPPPGPSFLASQATWWGFFCAGAGTTGCLNNWKGEGGIKFGSGISSANTHGEFMQWLYGEVSSQWPFANSAFYLNYRGNSVYQYAWAPSGKGSGQCVSALWGLNQGLSLQNCAGSGDEFFVWDGNAHWVNVLWTSEDYNDNPTNPHSWCAGSTNSTTNDGDWIATERGCSLKWHAYGGPPN